MRCRFATLLVLLAAAPASAQSNFPFFEPVQPQRATQVMAHRGMHMLAPENPLHAVLACATDYIEWAEILSAELIEKSHKAGIQVFADSLADEHEKVEQYQVAIGWGIDVIQTNHPLRVLRAIELMQTKRP